MVGYSDSDPYIVAEDSRVNPSTKAWKNVDVISHSLSLSLNNQNQKTRTILTSFAGSIGIIGIALILALSAGINDYVRTVQMDTLSVYPIRIESESVDMSSMITTLMEQNRPGRRTTDRDKVYSNNIATSFLSSVSAVTKANDLGAFKEYLESEASGILDYVSTIQYGYKLDLQIYSSDTTDGVLTQPSNC